MTSSLQDAKQTLWIQSGRNLQWCVIAACATGTPFPPQTPEDCQTIAREIQRRRENPIDTVVIRRPIAPIKEPTDHHNWKQRYRDAHKLNCQREYPAVWKDGHYCTLRGIDLPDVGKHGGLITFMVNYINWVGGNAYRLNNATMVKDKITTELSGNKFKDKQYIKSGKKGIADVQGTLLGKKLQLDAKVGRDTPSDFQLEQQRRERRAQGVYEFIRDTDDFFNIIDPLLYG